MVGTAGGWVMLVDVGHCWVARSVPDLYWITRGDGTGLVPPDEGFPLSVFASGFGSGYSPGVAAGALGKNLVVVVLPSMTAAANSVSRCPWVRA